jgi:hypothetical protein
MPTAHGRTTARDFMRLAWIANVSVEDAGSDRSAASALSQERLFEALDGRTVGLFHRRWEIRVFGITEQNGWRWLQLTLAGEPEHMLTLRTSVWAGVDETLREVSRWLANPARADRFPSVA